jgi:hypothetical protein
MPHPPKNESWLIGIGGEVVEKQAREGAASLTPWETLVYCLWVADYGMRNAGDLDTASDLYARFKRDAKQAAKTLAPPLSLEAFSLPKAQLQREYFDRFEAVCTEIKRAKSND